MQSRCTFAVLFIHTLISECVTVTTDYNDTPDTLAKSKIELPPLLVSAGLEDTIVISAPIVNKNSLYYLSKPTGDYVKLEMNTSVIMSNYENSRTNDAINYTIKHLEAKVITVLPANNDAMFNRNYHNSCFASAGYFVDETRKLEKNHFTVGPLAECDHGNWILSVYFKGNDGEWIELFQVISIEIIESLQTEPPNTKLVPGESFEPRFAYTIRDLESCEIIAPRTAFDRLFDRSGFYPDSCGFQIPNVTKADEGIWRLLGVGNIVYEGQVYLEIDDKTL